MQFLNRPRKLFFNNLDDVIANLNLEIEYSSPMEDGSVFRNCVNQDIEINEFMAAIDNNRKKWINIFGTVEIGKFKEKTIEVKL